jgi:hypothetical protein
MTREETDLRAAPLIATLHEVAAIAWDLKTHEELYGRGAESDDTWNRLTRLISEILTRLAVLGITVRPTETLH